MLTFIQSADRISGYDNSMYLGRVLADEVVGGTLQGDLGQRTLALREFNLPTTRAPEDWPMVHGDLEARVQRFNDRELSWSARGELRPSDCASEDPLGS